MEASDSATDRHQSPHFTYLTSYLDGKRHCYFPPAIVQMAFHVSETNEILNDVKSAITVAEQYDIPYIFLILNQYVDDEETFGTLGRLFKQANYMVLVSPVKIEGSRKQIIRPYGYTTIHATKCNSDKKCNAYETPYMEHTFENKDVIVLDNSVDKDEDKYISPSVMFGRPVLIPYDEKKAEKCSMIANDISPYLAKRLFVFACARLNESSIRYDSKIYADAELYPSDIAIDRPRKKMRLDEITLASTIEKMTREERMYDNNHNKHKNKFVLAIKTIERKGLYPLIDFYETVKGKNCFLAPPASYEFFNDFHDGWTRDLVLDDDYQLKKDEIYASASTASSSASSTDSTLAAAVAASSSSAASLADAASDSNTKMDAQITERR